MVRKVKIGYKKICKESLIQFFNFLIPALPVFAALSLQVFFASEDFTLSTPQALGVLLLIIICPVISFVNAILVFGQSKVSGRNWRASLEFCLLDTVFSVLGAAAWALASEGIWESSTSSDSNVNYWFAVMLLLLFLMISFVARSYVHLSYRKKIDL